MMKTSANSSSSGVTLATSTCSDAELHPNQLARVEHERGINQRNLEGPEPTETESARENGSRPPGLRTQSVDAHARAGRQIPSR